MTHNALTEDRKWGEDIVFVDRLSSLSRQKRSERETVLARQLTSPQVFGRRDAMIKEENQRAFEKMGCQTDWLDMVVDVHDLPAVGLKARRGEIRLLGVRHDPATIASSVTLSCRNSPM